MSRTITFAAFLTAVSAAAPVSGQIEPFSLDGLVVTAGPTARPADAVANHVSVISGEDLRAFGVRSLTDALRDVSGVMVARPGSFGAVASVFLRGGESDYTLVLVDGVQVNQAGGGFDFSALTTDNVERIEIVRGPASAVYGSDAVTGVIHVITRMGGGAPVATGRFEGGSFGRADWGASVRGGTDLGAYSVSIERRESDGIYDFNNRHEATTVSGSARLMPDERTDLRVHARLVDRSYGFPTDGSGEAVDRNAYTFEDASVVRLTAARVVAPWAVLRAGVSVNETDGGTDDAQDSAADSVGFYGFTSLDDFRRSAADVRIDARTEQGVLSLGYEYEHEQQRSFNESLSQFGPSNGRSESERRNHAGLVHFSGATGAVSYNGGVRIEDNERYGRQSTWQLGLAALLAEATGTRLRASVGTAIKEPTFSENFATGFATGNPDLQPEQARSWEVGLEQPLAGDRVRFGLTWFDQAFTDLIQYTFAPPNPGDPNYFNIAAADATGLEAVADLVLDGVTAGVSWTRLDTEVVDSGFDSGEGATFVDGEALLRRPAHTLTLRAHTRLSAVDLTGRYTRVGSRSDRDFGTFPATPVTLPAYGLMSLSGRWAAVSPVGTRPGLSIEVRAENLLDASYEEAIGFRAPGRALYVGGSISWGGTE